jgi:hypothetical protein
MNAKSRQEFGERLEHYRLEAVDTYVDCVRCGETRTWWDARDWIETGAHSAICDSCATPAEAAERDSSPAVRFIRINERRQELRRQIPEVGFSSVKDELARLDREMDELMADAAEDDQDWLVAVVR